MLGCRQSITQELSLHAMYKDRDQGFCVCNHSVLSRIAIKIHNGLTLLRANKHLFVSSIQILLATDKKFARHGRKRTHGSNLVGIFDIFIRNVCKIRSRKVCSSHNDKTDNVVSKVCKSNSRELYCRIVYSSKDTHCCH